MSAKTKWVVAIVGLLVGNVLAMMVLIVAAHTGGSRVLPSYYDQAVHYDDRIDEDARDRQLAWQVDVRIERGIVSVTARDASGRPVAGARVSVDGVERARARSITGALAETRAGEYRAELGGAGWIDLVIAVERGGDRFVRRLAIEAR